ncbi:MAG TPA: circularly permuted type 2 ATP-grasp protein, partial [Polyangiaceae bacterium]
MYRRAAEADSYDELLDATGKPRPAWQKVLAMLEAMGEPELRRNWDHARALLHDHGVSYDAYGDPKGERRPWSLSPLPVVIDAASWAKLSQGIIQRARLLDRILADLYGPQRLLTSGEIPPELVFGNPSFLRTCWGFAPPGGHYLPFYAADIARAPDGRFTVLADRTQAPAGAGYALENRIVLSRALPEVFRECNVERLAPFFRALRDTLRQLAPYNRDNPRIALLTPGPYNATYFEQAFLAQYLGLTLVQGADLAVRDHRVFLKTLGGLQQVDVILRRVNDDFCDPLELRPESMVGVPGLVEASRAGNVAVANPLGSGLIQSPALMDFLPSLCRKVLGEELLLPSPPTYWCGDPSSLAYVESHLAELVIKTVFRAGQSERTFGRDLSATALEQLRARIRSAPRNFVAQDAVVLSTVPTLGDGGLMPAHLWMRAYAVVSGNSYEVMPGGLSRVGGPGERLGLSLRPGGQSKDTWVLGGGPIHAFSLLPPPSTPVPLSRGGGDLPSRVADNLFWLGRYAERAEGTARLIRTIAARLGDQSSTSEPQMPGELAALFAVLDALTHAPHPRNAKAAETESIRGRPAWLLASEKTLLASVFDDEPFETLKMIVASTYRVARSLRDRISGDTWRTLAQLDRDVCRSPGITGPSSLRALTEMLDDVVTCLAAFSGLAVDSMTRGQAWRFLDIGRRLERGLHMATLLRYALGSSSPRETQLLEALLEVADSSMTYRRRYLATLQVAPVVDLLLTDDTNPRAVLFQLAALLSHIEALPQEAGAPTSTLGKLVLRASADLR